MEKIKKYIKGQDNSNNNNNNNNSNNIYRVRKMGKDVKIEYGNIESRKR